MSDQLALNTTACKVRGCMEPVVGHSVKGTGHVCKRHNEREWGERLCRCQEEHYRALGRRLLDDARRPA